MRWVIVTGTYDVCDLAANFCGHHLELGADRIFIVDYGSKDGTIEALTPFVRGGQVRVIPLPTQRFADYNPSQELLRFIRAEEPADWVSFLDPDEFLLGHSGVRPVLNQALTKGLQVLKAPRSNMTGEGPPPLSASYLEHLTLKIIETDIRMSNSAAPLSSPWIFSRLPPKVTIAARKELIQTKPGDHEAVGADEGRTISHPGLEILHYPIRGFEPFRRKVEASARYLAANPEFSPGIAWHWRRWVAMLETGELQAEFERQFLSPESVRNLTREGKLVADTRLAEEFSLRLKASHLSS